MSETAFTCDACGEKKPGKGFGLGTGYGITPDGEKHCYACCARHTATHMCHNGEASLYLVKHSDGWVVSDWAGELMFRTRAPRKGRHNIAGVRYDVWFRGPDDHWWWGVTYGDGTQVCHCKRTKEKLAHP